MKVRIGKGGWTNSATEAEQRFQSQVMSAIKEQAIYVGRPQIADLGEQLKEVAVDQAHQLFNVLADKIDQQAGDVRGLSGADLADGCPASLDTSGFISWKPLTYNYYMYKKRHTSNADRMFRFKGYLSGYFRRSGASIVDSRFGGVTLTVNTDGLAGEQRDDFASTEYFVSGGDQSLQRFLIGRLDLKIFPNVSAGLLPGLAANRWTAMLGSGDEATSGFEDTYFDDLRTRQKLIQRHGGRDTYRPLVMPAVQFWVLVRIPGVLRDRLRQYVNRTQLKGYTPYGNI